ncbi:hypothetical protein GUITHDRAFT_150594 [Guillardia theta CCMP2712]|uniref:Uncharacterized protein n=1 Tax=Guillardia theta (strain CCMP2712) TaxID=905079 RepID=L1JWM2_GUITC|nr:hypothetical protein GUITHDRAFT_150594 [Guillardia theta CCMP2712]EKX52605.1 hypothetical protein GUITHDRAFT_150594 [Guillardia theta CCMP2712]|eukprot:XP_005839585.1 hypothetical protein GUITHDRAFT_150594 [Guillardia theta CCMP2712]
MSYQAKIRGACKKIAPDRVLKMINEDTKCSLSDAYDHLYKALHQEMLANQILKGYDYFMMEDYDKSSL